MESDYIAVFDALHTTKSIQKLKILHAFCPPEYKAFIAVYICIMNLQYTMKFYKETASGNTFTEPSSDMNIKKILQALTPYCDENELAKLNQFAGMIDSMETIRNMQETMDIMKDIFPEGQTDMFSSDMFETFMSAMQNNPVQN